MGSWETGVGDSWIWMWIEGQTFVLVTTVTGGGEEVVLFPGRAGVL